MNRSFLLALVLLPGCGSESATPRVPAFRFTAIPNEDAQMLRAKYRPVAAFLQEQVGHPVEYVPASTYDAAVTMLIHGEVQMAWLGGFTGVQARNEIPEARAIVKGALDAAYKSYFIAAKGTELRRGEEFPMGLAGKKFAFGDKTSTSGRLMPEYFIRKATGRSPDELFAQVHFSGSHPNTIRLVRDGAFDAGVVDFAVYDGMVRSGELDPEDCPVIWETPAFADYQFTVRPGIDAVYGEGFEERLTGALLAMGEPLAAAFRRQRMVRASNADFGGIREVAEQLGMIRGRDR